MLMILIRIDLTDAGVGVGCREVLMIGDDPACLSHQRRVVEVAFNEFRSICNRTPKLLR